MLTLFEPLKPITPACGPLFQPYYTAFAAKRKWPRHYLALTNLGKFPHNFGYTRVGDCLVVVKRKLLGANKIVYAAFPPMHITGDSKIEKEVTDSLLAIGMSVRMLREDFVLLGLENPRFTVDPSGPEFIYGATEMRAGANDTLKYAINQSQKMAREGKVSLRTVTHLTPEDLEACESVSKAWRSSKGVNPPNDDYALHFFNAYAEYLPGNHAVSLIEEEAGGHLVLTAFSITEQVSSLWGVITTRKTRYVKVHVKEPTRAIHGVDGAYWASVCPGSQWNIGTGSRSKNLEKAKRLLHPTCESHLLNLRPTFKQHPELWEYTKVVVPTEPLVTASVLDLLG